MKKGINWLKLFLTTTLVVAATSSALLSQNSALSQKELEEKADEIHSKYLTIDTHNDTALRLVNPDTYYRLSTGQVTFEKMKEGGLDAALFAIYIGQGKLDRAGLDSATHYVRDNLTRFREYVEDYPQVAIAYNSNDLIRNKENGVTSVMLAIENGYAIGDDLANLEMFRDIGVRAITLCHNENNLICDASMDKSGPSYNGLSQFGHQVIEEMNRLGIIIDVSHAAPETVFDILEVSKYPIMASHSGVWGVKNHNRNLKDEEIIAIAKGGGLIQIATGRFFLSELPKEQVTVSHIADHIDYAVKLVGINHVGLGTDYDGGGGVVGMESADKMKNLTIELLKRGYTQEELEKFWGANFIRFLKTQNM